jgi:hypothetical protein
VEYNNTVFVFAPKKLQTHKIFFKCSIIVTFYSIVLIYMYLYFHFLQNKIVLLINYCIPMMNFVGFRNSALKTAFNKFGKVIIE